MTVLGLNIVVVSALTIPSSRNSLKGLGSVGFSIFSGKTAVSDYSRCTALQSQIDTSTFQIRLHVLSAEIINHITFSAPFLCYHSN